MGSRSGVLEMQLVEMGFERHVVQKALERSTFTSVPRAMEWILQHQDSLEAAPQKRQEAPRRPAAEAKRPAPASAAPPGPIRT